MNNKRLNKDEYSLNIAEAVLARSTCLRQKYGAVLVKDGEIIATGYNGSPRGSKNCCDLGHCKRDMKGIPYGERYEICPAVHAEQVKKLTICQSRTQSLVTYVTG